METLGWISAILLAACGLPQCIKSFREKSSLGVSVMFIWMWFLGEILGLAYVLYKGDMPLILNYSFNTIFTSVILYYYCFPKK